MAGTLLLWVGIRSSQIVVVLRALRPVCRKVDPSIRGRGIGSALVDALEREARLLGTTTVVLETGTRLMPAIKLYEALGYARIPLFGEYLSSPEHEPLFQQIARVRRRGRQEPYRWARAVYGSACACG
jgi:N-acetylglutamate synthase-like GNAT family acetyltransferase